MMASRSPSPSPSEGSWEEVGFTELQEDSHSDDGLVVLGKTPPARSRTRSPCKLEAAEKVQPENSTMARTARAGQNTAARILQAWWRTRAVPSVHLPDADEDEVMSEELDEEEDQEDEVQLADGYKSCKELLPQWIQQHEAEDEPGEEPEAEADSCSPKAQSPWMAPSQASPGLHFCQQSKQTLSEAMPALKQSSSFSPWAVVLGAALALSLGLALHGSGWSATTAEMPERVPRSVVAHGTAAQTTPGNSTLEASLEMASFEAMRQEIAAARAIASAALREAMDAQSSWLAEAKARREAEKAVDAARWQLEQVRQEAARSMYEAALAVNRSSNSRDRSILQEFEEDEEDNDESLYEDFDDIDLATWEAEELSRSRALWLPPWGRDLVVWGLKKPLAEPQMTAEKGALRKDHTPKSGHGTIPTELAHGFLLEPPKVPQVLAGLDQIPHALQNHWRQQVTKEKAQSQPVSGTLGDQPQPQTSLQPLLLQQLELVQRMQRPLRLEPPKPKQPETAVPSAPHRLAETAMPAKKHIDQQLSLMVWQQRRQLPQLPTPSPTELPLNWFRLPSAPKIEEQPRTVGMRRPDLPWQLPRMETSTFEGTSPTREPKPAEDEVHAALKTWRENHRRYQEQLWQEQRRTEKHRQESELHKEKKVHKELEEEKQRSAEKQRRWKLKQQWKAKKAWPETDFRAAATEARAALVKSAETLSKQAEQFIVEAGFWATKASHSAAQKAKQARCHAKKAQRKAAEKVQAAEEKVRKKLQKARRKAEAVAEKARRKAEWTLEKGRKAAEKEAKKARKYVAEQVAGISSSLLKAGGYVW